MKNLDGPIGEEKEGGDDPRLCVSDSEFGFQANDVRVVAEFQQVGTGIGQKTQENEENVPLFAAS